MIKLAIHSVPRSGSSWLGELINSSEDVNYSYQPLFSYRFKSYLNDSSSKEDIDTFFNEIKDNNDEFVRQIDARKQGIKPNFVKSDSKCIAYKEVRYHHILSNLLNINDDVKVIGLVRNPLAVIASWYNAPREFRKDLGWTLESELLTANKKNEGRQEEYFGLLKWIETTLEFEKLCSVYKDRFYLIRYDDLIEDTSSEVKKLYDFIGLDISEQVYEFIHAEKKNADTYSVFKLKKTDDSWKNVLSSDVQNVIIETVTKAGLDKYL